MSNDYDRDISNIYDQTQFILKQLKSSEGGFFEYKRHILHQLDTHEQAIEQIDEEISSRIKELEDKHDTDLVRLKEQLRLLRVKVEKNRNFYAEKLEEVNQRNHKVHLIAAKTATKISIGISIFIMILMLLFEQLTGFLQ